MRFKNRAFALIWIVLSVALCCGLFSQYENNTVTKATVVSANTLAHNQIDNEKLSIFLLFVALLSLSMGVFFFAYSDELRTYLGNYKRTKEI